MDYIFGNKEINGQVVDILETIGEEHTNLVGSQSTIREYPDNIITDTFIVREKYRSAEDEAGNCYDWYILDNHYRYTDTYTPDKKELDQKISEITPYTATKTAYIEDTEVIFNDVPDGTMSVSVKDSGGNYPAYTAERTANRVIIHFVEPLTKVTTVAISVL